jgi:hypothetical protein
MGKAIPTQHPAVVLRSHYRQLRALLAIAMIAVVGLTAAVVILAINNDGDAFTSAAPAAQASAPSPTGGIRYDGGPEEGTAAITPRSAWTTFESDSIKRPPGVRYDGGPEEGTSGALSAGADSNAVPGIRYDGGPEEGSSGVGH